MFQNSHKSQSFNLILIIPLLENCFSPFPEVAESVQQELESYRAQEDEVKRLKSIMVRFCLLSWKYKGSRRTSGRRKRLTIYLYKNSRPFIALMTKKIVLIKDCYIKDFFFKEILTSEE